MFVFNSICTVTDNTQIDLLEGAQLLTQKLLKQGFVVPLF
jgi:hypothetical protein